jgi:hypothetical protein
LSYSFIIDDLFIRQARNLLESGDEQYSSIEEKRRKEIIIAVCLKYKFKYQFINEFVFIYSIIDEWYFPYMNDNIPLCHKNRLHTTNQYHFQKKFTNIFHVLQYIRKHDNFYYKP